MKAILTFTLALLTPWLAAGQSSFGFGPRLGGQFSSFFGEKHNAYTPGVYAGGFVNFNVSPALSIELDLLYAEAGGTRLSVHNNVFGEDQPILRQTITSHVSLRNLELPLLLNFSPWQNLPVKPYFSAGPSMTVLVHGFDRRDITMEFNPAVYPPINDPIFGERPIVATTTDTENVTSEYNRYSLNGVLGGGLEIPFTKFTMKVDLRYRMGLTPVDQWYNPLNLVGNSSSLKSHSTSLSVALTF